VQAVGRETKDHVRVEPNPGQRDQRLQDDARCCRAAEGHATKASCDTPDRLPISVRTKDEAPAACPTTQQID